MRLGQEVTGALGLWSFRRRLRRGPSPSRRGRWQRAIHDVGRSVLLGGVEGGDPGVPLLSTDRHGLRAPRAQRASRRRSERPFPNCGGGQARNPLAGSLLPFREPLDGVLLPLLPHALFLGFGRDLAGCRPAQALCYGSTAPPRFRGFGASCDYGLELPDSVGRDTKTPRRIQVASHSVRDAHRLPRGFRHNALSDGTFLRCVEVGADRMSMAVENQTLLAVQNRTTWRR